MCKERFFRNGVFAYYSRGVYNTHSDYETDHSILKLICSICETEDLVAGLDERRWPGGEQSVGDSGKSGIIQKKFIFTNYNSVTDIHNPSPFLRSNQE